MHYAEEAGNSLPRYRGLYLSPELIDAARHLEAAISLLLTLQTDGPQLEVGGYVDDLTRLMDDADGIRSRIIHLLCELAEYAPYDNSKV